MFLSETLIKVIRKKYDWKKNMRTEVFCKINWQFLGIHTFNAYNI